jgi:hypothetical protein
MREDGSLTSRHLSSTATLTTRGWGDNTSHEVLSANPKRSLLPPRAQQAYDQEMAIFRKKHSTYLRDLSAYNAARDHMLTSGTYDDYYGEVLDSRGRVLETPTTPECSTSPPKSDVVPMVPPFQAIMASSKDTFTQELRAREQVWETDRIKNHLCVPKRPETRYSRSPSQQVF